VLTAALARLDGEGSLEARRCGRMFCGSLGGSLRISNLLGRSFGGRSV